MIQWLKWKLGILPEVKDRKVVTKNEYVYSSEAYVPGRQEPLTVYHRDAGGYFLELDEDATNPNQFGKRELVGDFSVVRVREGEVEQHWKQTLTQELTLSDYSPRYYWETVDYSDWERVK